MRLFFFAITTMLSAQSDFLIQRSTLAEFNQALVSDWMLKTDSTLNTTNGVKVLSREGTLFERKNAPVPEDHPKWTRYTYLGYDSDLDLHVVHESAYESESTYLVKEREGRSLQVWSKPILSGDKKWGISLSQNSELDGNDIGFQLIDMTTLKIKVMVKQSIWQPISARWLNNSEIHLKVWKLQSTSDASTKSVTMYYKIILSLPD